MNQPQPLRYQILRNIDGTLSIFDTADENKVVFTGTLAEVGWKRGQLELAAMPAAKPSRKAQQRREREQAGG